MAQWQTSSELKQAIKGAGISGLQFRLTGGSVYEDGMLGLLLRPVSAMPAGKGNQIGYSLAYIVGLTFASLAGSLRQMKVERASMTLPALGFSGVSMPTYELEYRSERFGPFQTIWKLNADESWRVSVHSIVRGGATSARLSLQFEALGEIMEAFRQLAGVPLILES